MTPLEVQLEEWHRRRYGETVDVSGTYRKLLEEVGELGEALLLDDYEKIEEEAADVGIVLTHLLRGATAGSLVRAMEGKTEEIERRLTSDGKSEER